MKIVVFLFCMLCFHRHKLNLDKKYTLSYNALRLNKILITKERGTNVEVLDFSCFMVSDNFLSGLYLI